MENSRPFLHFFYFSLHCGLFRPVRVVFRRNAGLTWAMQPPVGRSLAVENGTSLRRRTLGTASNSDVFGQFLPSERKRPRLAQKPVSETRFLTRVRLFMDGVFIQLDPMPALQLHCPPTPRCACRTLADRKSPPHTKSRKTGGTQWGKFAFSGRKGEKKASWRGNG